jgi:hypothetical protein
MRMEIFVSITICNICVLMGIEHMTAFFIFLRGYYDVGGVKILFKRVEVVRHFGFVLFI